MTISPFFGSLIASVEGVTPERVQADPSLMAGFAPSLDGWTAPTGVSWEDVTIAGPNGPLKLRVYRSATGGDGRAGLLWMHGGGFRVGSIEWPEAHAVSAELVARTNAVVVSVDYGLAEGGVRHPALVEDVLAGWDWLISHSAELGVGERLYVGGGSAGANLAAAASLRLRDESRTSPSGMLLAYGVYHFPVPGVSPAQQDEFRILPELLRGDIRGHIELWSNYVGRIDNIPHDAAPGNGDLAGMPPAWMIRSEYDELIASSELFALQLRSHDILVTEHLAEGMIHGHLNWPPSEALPEVSRSIDFFATALSRPGGEGAPA